MRFHALLNRHINNQPLAFENFRAADFIPSLDVAHRTFILIGDGSYSFSAFNNMNFLHQLRYIIHRVSQGAIFGSKRRAVVAWKYSIYVGDVGKNLARWQTKHLRLI